LIQRVRQEILQTLPSGEPKLEQVADRLLVSQRSLQRHLEAQGISFRDLLDGIRQQSAINQLLRTDHSLKEIAFLLGFSNQSNFSNAFKRWTGASPGEYRASHLQPSNIPR
ncbi:MAG: helix-turn-helix transcriptional regulator, partial [Perlucidibaca sp.]